MKKPKKKRFVIKTPFPTARETAKELGVKTKRAKKIEKMMDGIFKKSAKKKATKKNNRQKQ